MKFSKTQRFFSWVYPFTRKVDSEYSGQLEITIINGKKVLDTENANYSYGSVHRIFNFGLKQFDFSTINSVLLLGLGGGTIVKILRDEMDYVGKITAVEKDAVIIQVAKDEFGIKENAATEIICADALSFVKDIKKQYNLIIVDIFIDNTVPKSFLEIPFWKNVIDKISPSGQFLFNSINDTTDSLAKLKSWYSKNAVSIEEFPKVDESNTLIKGVL